MSILVEVICRFWKIITIHPAEIWQNTEAACTWLGQHFLDMLSDERVPMKEPIQAAQ